MKCTLHGDPVKGIEMPKSECSACRYHTEYTGLFVCTYRSPEQREIAEAKRAYETNRIPIQMRRNQLKKLRRSYKPGLLRAINEIQAELWEFERKQRDAEQKLRSIEKKHSVIEQCAHEEEGNVETV